MSEPLNPDPEIQADIDETIRHMATVEANYRKHYTAILAATPTSFHEQEAQRELLASVARDWRASREPYVESILRLVASTREGGVTYLSPISPEIATRVRRSLSTPPD